MWGEPFTPSRGTAARAARQSIFSSSVSFEMRSLILSSAGRSGSWKACSKRGVWAEASEAASTRVGARQRVFMIDYDASPERSRGGRMRRAVLGLAVACGAASLEAQTTERLKDGVALGIAGRRLELRVCRDDLVRVVDATPGPFFSRQSLATVPSACQPTPFEVKTGASGVDVVTKRLTARVALPTGAVSFLDRQGRVLLAEKPSGRALEPAEVMGEKTFHVRAEFLPQDG